MWDETIEKKLEEMEAYALGEEKGMEEGIKEGIKEGSNEKQNEIIINMHNNGLSLEMISNCTKLSKEEIQKIIDQR